MKGRGYCLPWSDNRLGWINGNYVHDKRAALYGLKHPFPKSPNAKPERAFLCEITIKPVLKKDGTPITRILHPEEEADPS